MLVYALELIHQVMSWNCSHSGMVVVTTVSGAAAMPLCLQLLVALAQFSALLLCKHI